MTEHIYTDFALVAALSMALIIGTIMVFYEALRVVWVLRERLARKPRLLIHCMVLSVFAAHTACVWLYGISYWLLAEKMGLGGFHGHIEDGHWMHYVYYSATTYSSLGFGDINPSGAMRLLSGVEVLNGLLLIGWSVTYTYFATEKYLNHIKHEQDND